MSSWNTYALNNGQFQRCQGNKVKNNGTHEKILSEEILMWNIKDLALTVQKLLAMLKFKKKWVKPQGQHRRVKLEIRWAMLTKWYPLLPHVLYGKVLVLLWETLKSFE